MARLIVLLVSYLFFTLLLIAASDEKLRAVKTERVIQKDKSGDSIMSKTLLLVETSGIQNYVFGSNELLQNIGASELVAQATSKWVVEVLDDLVQGKHNTHWDRGKHDIVLNPHLVLAPALEAEVIYSGGGNALILFANHDELSKEFAKALSMKALREAPGLQLVLKQMLFDPAKDKLSASHQQLITDLAKRKLARIPSVPLLGLGVTAECVFTGKPAVEWKKDEQPISSEVVAKLAVKDKGIRRLNGQLASVDLKDYEFIYDFDHFGTKGESTYLAVIHADGNNMGDRIKAIGKDYPVNDEYVRKLRGFSDSVKTASSQALQATMKMLLDNIVVDAKNNTRKIADRVPIPFVKGKKDSAPSWRLPFRPIVFGGDDVTFVCEGRLGLTIATKYLHEFSQQKLADGENAYARAGVAVVKSHFPFSRAYELADDLCGSAKMYIKEWEKKKSHGVTALDWHFAVTGLVRPLKEIREREYQVDAGNLCMRPLCLSDPDDDWRSWQTFKNIMEKFRLPEAEKGHWAGRRNKLKALRVALRNGEAEVRQFLKACGHKLPDIPQESSMKSDGWQVKSAGQQVKSEGEQDRRCGYFDAIEALDFYLPLQGGLL